MTEPILAIEPAPLEVSRIVALKLDHRGDFIMATGAFEALRARFPGAHLTLACGDWNREDAARTGLFDRVVGCDFFPESLDQASHVVGDEPSLRAFATLFAGERFDLAIDLRLHPETRVLLPLLDAAVRAGFGTNATFPFLDIALPFANPTESGRAQRVALRAEGFRTNVGIHEGYAIVSAEPLADQPADGILVFGPYAELDAGQWEIRLDVEPLAESFELGFDVTAAGDDMLGAGRFPVARGRPPRIILHLAQAARGLEIRLRAGPSRTVPPFRFLGGQARRRGTFAGPHQAEMQFLLCCLADYRLRQPWRITEITG